MSHSNPRPPPCCQSQGSHMAQHGTAWHDTTRHGAGADSEREEQPSSAVSVAKESESAAVSPGARRSRDRVGSASLVGPAAAALGCTQSRPWEAPTPGHPRPPCSPPRPCPIPTHPPSLGIPAGALPAARSAGSCGGSQDGGPGSRWHGGETAAGTLLPIPVKPRALGHIVQCQGANTRFGVSWGAR